ncbi:MAG: hypothetical protein M3N14_00655, partial [Bacteroidota bacterium]|nr:hypothetical protein [Bacteroidota bacterium]
MKSIFLLLTCFFFLTTCFSQETIERKNKLTDSVTERFFVLKSDKETKHGLYLAFFRRKTLIARGAYTKGKKTGGWNFYSTNGQPAERYNYDTNTLSFEAPYDPEGDVGFLFDDKIKPTDVATRPLKIGGSYYGYIPYVKLFRLPFDSFGVNTDVFEANIELLISPLGRLAEYKVHLVSQMYQYDHTITIDFHLLNEEDQVFIPATLN